MFGLHTEQRQEQLKHAARWAYTLWPWGWSLSLYAVAAWTAQRLGHWPGCCREAAKWTAPYGLGQTVKMLALWALLLHLCVLGAWLYAMYRRPRLPARELRLHAALFGAGFGVVVLLLLDLDPGHVLSWAID
jgi:hypothetical protein